MASGRILMKYSLSTVFLLFFALLIWACGSSEPYSNPGTTQESTNNEPEEKPDQTNENSNTQSEEELLMISSLSDLHASQSNDIPEAFTQIKVPKEVEVDLTKGYRIQIYSGQDLNDADTTAMRFRAWSDTTLVGYQPETYTFFKTPFYRVHIGDFHDRQRALNFSKIVKRIFRDAWVVYDTVDPFSVPADTTQITTR